MFLEDNVNDIIKSITFARFKIIHRSIISPDHFLFSLSEISQDLVGNYSNIAKYLDVIELKSYQSLTDVVFVLKVTLVEQQTSIFHLYPFRIYDNRTGCIMFYHSLNNIFHVMMIP